MRTCPICGEEYAEPPAISRTDNKTEICRNGAGVGDAGEAAEVGEDRDAKNTNLPLISVIVPIYNVEKYVRKCLESLKNQTMKQIEVIMVDDGSTDRSGEIAEEYVSEPGAWPVFSLIRHEENRGLSAARNTGLDVARSQWIMFVDSDDWVEAEFCRVPYEAAIKNQADMVIFCSYFEKNDKTRIQGSKYYSVGIVTPEIAVENGNVVVWNKLYNRRLFQEIRYPEGRVYEDIATTHKLVYKANKILFLKNVLYHQIYRKDSLSQVLSAKNKRDGFISALERYNDLCKIGCPVEKHQNLLWDYAIGLITREGSDDQLVKRAEEVVDAIDGIPKSLSYKKRIMLLIWRIDRRLFNFTCRILGQKDISH